jgi:hypothetical protein
MLNHDQCICAKYAHCILHDSVLDFAPIDVRNFSEVAVAIHNLGNQLINFGNFMLQFKSLLVVCCILIFFFFFSGFFFDPQGNDVGSVSVVDFVCSNGQSFCFQWCPFDSGHGFIAFLLQRGIHFGIGVSVVVHHFPVLKLMREWGIKS